MDLSALLGDQAPQQQQAPQQPQGKGLLDIALSPLGQSLLAGYFAGIGAPRLSGWGGALSRGGLAALGQYGQASQIQSMDAYRVAEGKRQEALAQKTLSDISDQQSLEAAASSIDQLAEVASQGPQKAAIHQLALSVRNGALDPKTATVEAQKMIRSSTGTAYGMTPNAGPYAIDKSTGTYKMVPQAGAQQAPPQTPSQPPSVAPSGGLDIELSKLPPQVLAAVKNRVAVLAKNHTAPEIEVIIQREFGQYINGHTSGSNPASDPATAVGG